MTERTAGVGGLVDVLCVGVSGPAVHGLGGTLEMSFGVGGRDIKGNGTGCYRTIRVRSSMQAWQRVRDGGGPKLVTRTM